MRSRDFAAALLAALALPASAAAQVTAELPAVNGRVASIRFFEMGADFPDLADRRFANRFDAASTRFISTQLDLEMPAPGRTVHLPIRCLYLRPDGSGMGEVDLSFEVQPDWTRPFNAQGRGWAEPGVWTVGTYRVRCTLEGRTVAEDSFEIVNAPPTIPSISGKVGAIRFFPSSGGAVPRDQREYTTRFVASEARYVNMELQLAHEPLGRTATVAVGCPLVRDDGTLVTTLQLTFEIQPDWRNTHSSTGWGTADGGWWRPGTYRAYCIAEGNLIGEAFFTVTG